MKTYVYLLYLAEFFLVWEILQTKLVGKIETHILCSITFFLESWCLWDNVETYGKDRQATYGNVKQHMRSACCITKDTDTQNM
jgi:hypothetical protein